MNIYPIPYPFLLSCLDPHIPLPPPAITFLSLPRRTHKMPRASKLLPSLGHAASGAGGTVASTLAIYPLDLVNTRLKVQRQLRANGTIRECDAYDGILDAFHAIYTKEGGISALFAGLGSDLAKSAADSFLFFLFYTVRPIRGAVCMLWFRG